MRGYLDRDANGFWVARLIDRGIPQTGRERRGRRAHAPQTARAAIGTARGRRGGVQALYEPRSKEAPWMLTITPSRSNP